MSRTPNRQYYVLHSSLIAAARKLHTFSTLHLTTVLRPKSNMSPSTAEPITTRLEDWLRALARQTTLNSYAPLRTHPTKSLTVISATVNDDDRNTISLEFVVGGETVEATLNGFDTAGFVDSLRVIRAWEAEGHGLCLQSVEEEQSNPAGALMSHKASDGGHEGTNGPDGSVFWKVAPGQDGRVRLSVTTTAVSGA